MDITGLQPQKAWEEDSHQEEDSHLEAESSEPVTTTYLGKGSKKKSREKYGLLPNLGGGSPRVMKKPNCFFGKVFFQ